MTRKMPLLIAIVLAGCASVAPPRVQQRAEKVRARTAAMQAATERIVVVRGADIPNHPNYTALGKVRGYCEQSPSGNSQILGGDSMKQAAVRKYGDRVDGIVNASEFFVSTSGTTTVYTPGTTGGHWVCTGTAVSFNQSASAPAPGAN
jgi:type II secretory pathway pseudopilin PulG